MSTDRVSPAPVGRFGRKPHIRRYKLLDSWWWLCGERYSGEHYMLGDTPEEAYSYWKRTLANP